jgi:hypothetical protein
MNEVDILPLQVEVEQGCDMVCVLSLDSTAQLIPCKNWDPQRN